MAATLADVIVLSLASFFGAIGIALTGFGMAILYVFAWQTAVLLAGYPSDFKYAIFIQAIALVSAQPFLLRMAKIRQHASRDLMLYFVPITVISTPPGQLLASYIDTDLVKAIGGILITIVALFEAYQRFAERCRSESKSEPDDTGDDEQRTQAEHETSPPQEVLALEPKEASSDDKSDDGPKSVGEISDPLSPSAGTPTSDTPEVTNLPEASESSPPWTTSAKVLTLFAGGSSGFLGGLSGIRGPPVIVYFLYPPESVVFSKETQRAAAATMSAANVIMRIIYYLIDTFALGGDQSFRQEDWYLYLSVIVSAIIGVQLGAFLFEITKDSKATIRAVLTLLLLFCGISLLLSSFADV